MSNFKPYEKIYVDCACECSTHLVRFVYDQNELDDWFGDDDLGVWMENQIVMNVSLWRRIHLAFKYLSSRTFCKYGYWDCVSLTKKGAIDIIVLLSRALMRHQKITKEEYLKMLSEEIPEINTDK